MRSEYTDDVPELVAPRRLRSERASGDCRVDARLSRDR